MWFDAIQDAWDVRDDILELDKLDDDGDDGYGYWDSDRVQGVQGESLFVDADGLSRRHLAASYLNFAKLLEDVVSHNIHPEKCMQKAKLKKKRQYLPK